MAFADQGAAAVVVADIDGAGAGDVARAIEERGHRAVAVTVDVSREEDVAGLVDTAEERCGPVDLFCSNAGIFVPGGVEADDAAWARIWSINVLSHVYAARALVPRMLERGEGYLLHTASAAGLLTQLGSAPYSVTKHAVVALAEWLSITYGDRGIRVSCLCPQAVDTNLAATSARQMAPAGQLEPAGDAFGAPAAAASAAVDGVLTPVDVAAVVIEALTEERFLVLPHPEVARYERRRAEDRDRWLRGMRRLQAGLTGTT